MNRCFFLISAVLTLVSSVENILDLDLVGTATMSTLLKYGFSIEKIIGRICTKCMKKQWEVSGTVLFKNLYQMGWFSSENCLMGLKALLVQKWMNWYVIINLLIFTYRGRLMQKVVTVYYLRQLFSCANDAFFSVKSVSRLAFENLCISSSLIITVQINYNFEAFLRLGHLKSKIIMKVIL